MAVTFVVEDGTGKSDATAYIEVTDADQVVIDYSLSWPSGYTTNQKKKALNIGSRYMDARFDGKWKGYRGSQSQSMAWPRVDVVDTDGWWIDTNEIPAKLKQSAVEVATYFAESGSAFPTLDDGGTLSRKKIKVDVIEIEKEWLAGNAGSQINAKVDALLDPYLKGSGANGEVQRG